MRRYLYLAIAMSIASLLTVLPGLASAAGSAVLTAGSGGPDLAAGAPISASLASGTTADFATNGTQGVHCSASSFGATLQTNPAAPGTATESLDSQTFSGCTTNISGTSGTPTVTVDNLPFSSSVDSTGAVTVSGSLQTTITLRTVLGSITCVFATTSISGTATNPDNAITFTGQTFSKKSGSGLCPSTGTFTAKYSPILSGGTPVWVN
jgi:hypothetical protein